MVVKSIRNINNNEHSIDNPPSTYHGWHAQDGDVFAKMSHPNVVDGRPVLVREDALLKGLKIEKAHLSSCPTDTRAKLHISVIEYALRAVQAEKERRGIPLTTPYFPNGSANLTVAVVSLTLN